MTSEIKPCPFCGDALLGPYGDDEVGKFCSHGGHECYLAGVTLWDNLFSAWNRRAPLTVADALTVPEVWAMMDDLKAEAEEPCAYGDGCPAFGTRHGRCRACRFRELLAPFLNAMKEES